MINSERVPFSVVIPSRNTRDLTLRCLDSLPSDDGLDVVMVDDASEDGTVQAIRRRHPRVRVLHSEVRLGFTAAANRGLAHAKGRLLLLLNSDTELPPTGLAVIAKAFAESPRLGIAGARLHYPDGRAQWSGGKEPSLPWCFALASGLPVILEALPGFRRLRPPAGSHAGEVGWVTGAAMAMRREVWEELGPLDETFELYCQDLDFCIRARQSGWTIRILPGLHVLHLHGVSIAKQHLDSVGHKAPKLLWGDLIRWAEKHRGTATARRIAAVLRWGGRVRLLASTLAGPFLPPSVREVLYRDRVAHRNALLSISPTSPGQSSSPPPDAS